MQRAAVLYVAPPAQVDHFVVTAQNSPEPDAGILFQGDFADDARIGRDPEFTVIREDRSDAI